VRIPDDDAPAIDWLLFGQSGVVTWRQAVSALSPGRVRHLVGSGRWRKVCHGILVNQTTPLTREQSAWVAVLAAGDGALLAGLAAARAGGLTGRWRREAFDVIIPAGRLVSARVRRLGPGLPAVVVHRTRHLPDEHRQRARPDRTSMARSVVDAAQWASTDDDAIGIVAAACQQGRVTATEIRRVLDGMPQARRRRVVMPALADIDGGAGALSEIDFVGLCRRFGLPRPDLQERRVDAAGRVRYLDAYWRGYRLHAEVDGAHHMDVRQWTADMRRQNDVWLAGDRILRFPAHLCRSRPGEVAATLRAALEAAGWRRSEDLGAAGGAVPAERGVGGQQGSRTPLVYAPRARQRRQ